MSSEWISVKDRLPEVYQNVIAYGPNECEGDKIMFGDFGKYSNGVSFFCLRNMSSHEMFRLECGEKGVSHWMPLPEPPRMEK